MDELFEVPSFTSGSSLRLLCSLGLVLIGAEVCDDNFGVVQSFRLDVILFHAVSVPVGLFANIFHSW